MISFRKYKHVKYIIYPHTALCISGFKDLQENFYVLIPESADISCIEIGFDTTGIFDEKEYHLWFCPRASPSSIVSANLTPLVSGSHNVITPANKLKMANMTIVASGYFLPNSRPTIGANIEPNLPQMLAVANPVDLKTVGKSSAAWR